MNRCCLIFLGLLVPATALAGTVVPLSGAVRGELSHAATQMALQHTEAMGYGAAQLRLSRVMALRQGSVVRLHQVRHGLPVLDASVAVLVLDGKFVALSGKLFDVRGHLAAPAASRLSAAAAQRAVLELAPNATVRRSRLAIFSAVGLGARTVWVADVLIPSPFAIRQMLIDARTGKVLLSRSAMQHVKGKVYSTNPTVGKLVTNDLERLSGKKDALVGTYAKVQRCKLVTQSKVTCDSLAKSDKDGNFIYDPKEPAIDDAFAEVQGYYHVDRIHNWLATSFKFQRKGNQQINVVANFHYTSSGGQPTGYPNAFFGDMTGDGVGDLVFGQSSRDYIYDADVVYHEFTHSVVHDTANLTLTLDNLGAHGEPGSLNEGYADILSSTFAGDGIVGDYSKPGGIRQLTGKVHSCPKDLLGETHEDGKIWGKATWAIRAKAKDVKVFDEILYNTLASLTKTSGLADASKMFVQVAKAKDPTLAQEADAIFKARGMDTCSRIIPLAQNSSRQGYIMGKRIAPSLSSFPFSYQFELDVPKDATEVTVYLRGYGYGGARIGAYIRKDKPVEFSYNGSTYDRVKGTSSNTEVLTTKDAKNPLVPGSKYYVLPLNTGNNTGVFNVSWSAKVTKPDPDMGLPDQSVPDQTITVLVDAGPDGGEADTPPREGCGSCDVGGRGPGAWLLLLGLAGVLVLRRRRR